MKKTEDLNNYGKSLAVIVQDLPDNILKRNREESLRIIRKKLGLFRFFKFLFVFPRRKRELSKKDLLELRKRGLNNEVFINFMIEQTSLFLSLETLTSEQEAIDILQEISEAVLPVMGGQFYPSAEDLEQLADPFGGFRQFFLEGFEANRKDGIHDFEIIENNENVLHVNCTYCAIAETARLLTGSTKPAIPLCYYDDLIFPKWSEKLGIVYKRNNTIARGGQACDFRYHKL